MITVISVLTVAMIFLNVILLDSIADPDSDISDWHFYMILVLLVLIPVSFFMHDVPLSVPEGRYTVKGNLEIPNWSFKKDVYTELRVDSQGDFLIVSIRGLSDAGYKFDPDHQNDALFHLQDQTVKVIIDNPQDPDNRLDANLRFAHPVNASSLNISTADSIRAMKTSTKIIYAAGVLSELLSFFFMIRSIRKRRSQR